MIVISKTTQKRGLPQLFLKAISAAADPALVQQQKATFAYDHGEIKKLELAVKRKLQVLKMYSELKDFDYEAPNMTYDKKTGDVKIVDK